MEPRNPVHIFIVENDRIFLRLLDFIFDQDLRFRFLDFKSGEDSLRNLALEPRLVVIDHRLPGMNGIETMMEIREQMPDVHVVMMSGTADRKLPVEFLNAGANEHIFKDGNEIEALCDRIRTFIAGVDQPRQHKAPRGAKLRKKIYYAIIALALLVSLGYYFYL